MLKKNKKFVLLHCCFIALLLLIPWGTNQKVWSQETNRNNLISEISDLDKQIDVKKKEIEELQKKAEDYKKKIEQKKMEALNLGNQIAILDNQVVKIELDIKATEARLEQIALEIKSLELQIKEKEEEITENKQRLADLLNLIYRSSEKNYLEILILNTSFSEFFDQIQYLKELQTKLQELLNQVKKLKTELETKKKEKESKRQEEEKVKKDLEQEKKSLEEKMATKAFLLEQTLSSEREFQNLLLELRYEQQQIESEIVALERKIREKLAESDKSFFEGKAGDVVLSWPVDPSQGITAYFHDPDYPFRYIFEHPGIDIRAIQGTPVKAAAPGYVARAKDAGMGYSYIMIIHNNGVSTVYGHVSKILVQEDTYVIRGQTIGLSGGMPGTPGAGRLSTGPHLHFEVRLNGIPVNPLEYLP